MLQMEWRGYIAIRRVGKDLPWATPHWRAVAWFATDKAERTSTSNNVGSVKQKLKDSIQSSERFKDYSGIELILHNGETCLNTLRELDSAERDFNVVILLIDVTQCRKLIYGQQRFPLFYMKSLILYQGN